MLCGFPLSHMQPSENHLFHSSIWATSAVPTRVCGTRCTPWLTAHVSGHTSQSQPSADCSSPWMQSPSVQFSDSWLTPSQYLPPLRGGGAMHSRTLRCSHSGLHTDHSLHTSQLPSTEWGGRRNKHHHCVLSWRSQGPTKNTCFLSLLRSHQVKLHSEEK